MAQETRPFNQDKGINDVYDFNEYATGIWEEFLQSLSGDSRFIRKATEDDEVEENVEFIYTPKGAKLAERMRDRLIDVGVRHFPNDEFDIEIESNYYQQD